MRNATGASPYCRAHEVVMQSEIAKAESKGSLADIATSAIRDMFAGRKIDSNKVAQDLTEAIWESGGSFGEFRPDVGDVDWETMFQQARERVHAARGAYQQHRQQGSGQRQRPPSEDPEHVQRMRAVQAARATLGFGPRDAITKEILKARHRELAKRHHPDRGGSLERMKIINSAVDLIAGTL